MSENDTLFPVDGQLLMVLPKAGASIKNPDVKLPILRKDRSGYYLEMQVDSESEDDNEVAVTRRVPLNDISRKEWAELKSQYDKLDFSICSDRGINNALEMIADRRIQRLFIALLTFLNPRQVAIVLYLYREAAKQGGNPLISFRSNNLLESLGYTRTKEGWFTARMRSQLNQDLVALHRTELVFAQSLQKGEKKGAKVTVKSILRIRDYEIDNVPRNFDLVKAADYTYELADAYTVALEFFEGSSGKADCVMLPSTIDTQQKSGNNTQRDYQMKLIVYLASRMRWDKLTDGQYLIISKQYLLKNLDLVGSNNSRNNQILWRTIEQLKQEKYILDAHELPGKRKMTNVQFQINPDKLRCEGDFLNSLEEDD
jgi:hypothetical protein